MKKNNGGIITTVIIAVVIIFSCIFVPSTIRTIVKVEETQTIENTDRKNIDEVYGKEVGTFVEIGLQRYFVEDNKYFVEASDETEYYKIIRGREAELTKNEEKDRGLYLKTNGKTCVFYYKFNINDVNESYKKDRIRFINDVGYLLMDDGVSVIGENNAFTINQIREIAKSELKRLAMEQHFEDQLRSDFEEQDCIINYNREPTSERDIRDRKKDDGTFWNDWYVTIEMNGSPMQKADIAIDAMTGRVTKVNFTMKIDGKTHSYGGRYDKNYTEIDLNDWDLWRRYRNGE